MAILELRDLHTGYPGGPDILKGMTLEVEAGRGHCVIGPNGAGKSTMLKAVAGLLPARSGTILFEGEDLGSLRPDQRLAKGVCFVPQDPSIFPNMSVQENLAMGAYLVRDKDEVDRRLEGVLERFPLLRERSRQAAGTLSGGQQQLLLIGRALMIEPKLLLIDEPSLGLAPLIADQIFEEIAGLRELGITVLMVEQSVLRGLQASEWAYVFDLGVKRFEGPSAQMLDDDRIRELYMGKTASGAAIREEDA